MSLNELIPKRLPLNELPFISFLFNLDNSVSGNSLSPGLATLISELDEDFSYSDYDSKISENSSISFSFTG